MCAVLIFFGVVIFDFDLLRFALPRRETPPRRPLVGVVGESDGASSKGRLAFAGAGEAFWIVRLGVGAPVGVGVWLVDRRGRLGVDGGIDWSVGGAIFWGIGAGLAVMQG